MPPESWGSDAGLRRAARLGDGWLASAYNITADQFRQRWHRVQELLEQAGRDPADFANGIAASRPRQSRYPCSRRSSPTPTTSDPGPASHAQLPRDLDAILAQLRSRGADVADETQDMEGVGRFGWVTDPEGNRIELWQPA